VLLALALHGFVVLPLWVRFMGNMSPRVFFRGSQEAILTAFATPSSPATLPVTLRVAEENLKLPRKVSRFVLTVGASANHHGTALFEGITVLFLAQVSGCTWAAAAVHGAGLCILGGIGTAGIPSGSLPVIAMICGIVGLKPEGIAIILGVNTFLDMCRTSLNVTGDLATRWWSRTRPAKRPRKSPSWTRSTWSRPAGAGRSRTWTPKAAPTARLSSRDRRGCSGENSARR
jgi:DAACS family dicarboxylate/amino acid:cation (Na+ or H+) symporter